MKLLDVFLVLVVLVALAFWSFKVFIAIVALAVGLGVFTAWSLSHATEADWEDI